MNTKQKYLPILLVIIFMGSAILLGGWIAGETKASKPDYYFEIEKNIQLFGKVYEEVTKRYVEEIDPEKFMKAGINGMLRTLDPYTMFVEQESNASSHFQDMARGKYGGVGMRIAKRDGWVTVVEPPFEGTPSARAKIREGDKIIEVDGKSTEKLTTTETAQLLRGKIGTEVNIKVRRVGETMPMEFRLIRAEIKITEVSYSGFIQDKIGYIRLSQFSRYAGKQVHDSIAVLKNQGMEALIFDLRGNPGGLLESAVQVAENFIDKGEMIVYTKGRGSDDNRDYRSRGPAIWGEGPLVVLVDKYSASASEIVSGAIQDHDRGVIIGSPTFGKGLVQKVIPLTRDGSSLKITSSKYYIPSGRLIQKPNFMRTKDIVWGYDADKDTTKKKEKTFFTTAKREVKGAGGIVPDIKVELSEISSLVINLIMKSMFFNFALEYASHNGDLEKDFILDEKIISEFKEFLESKNFTYKNEAEEHIEALAKVINKDKYSDEVNNSFENLKKSLESAKENDFEKDLDVIKRRLRAEIAAKFWGTKGKYESQFKNIPEIQKAIEVLTNNEEYFSLLSNSTSGK
jgi:carboxyl-terminal processing protease